MGLARKQIANAPAINEMCKIITIPLTVGQADLFTALDTEATAQGEPNEDPLTGILISNTSAVGTILIGTGTTAVTKGIAIATGESLFLPIAQRHASMTYECAGEVDVMLFFE